MYHSAAFQCCFERLLEKYLGHVSDRQMSFRDDQHTHCGYMRFRWLSKRARKLSFLVVVDNGSYGAGLSS
jgi:hypothetical protein